MKARFIILMIFFFFFKYEKKEALKENCFILYDFAFNIFADKESVI